MLILLIIAIAAIGLGLTLLLLTASLRDIKVHKRPKDTKQGFVDLLKYASKVEEDVLLCKDGSLMMSWRYRAEDVTNLPDKIADLQAFRVNQVFSGFGNGWMLHVDAVRRPSPAYSDKAYSFFPDAVSQAVDEERRQLFETIGALYETEFVLTLTYLPPVLQEQKFIELMFDDENKGKTNAEYGQSILAQFKQTCANFEARMQSSMQLERLGLQNQKDEFGKSYTTDAQLSWYQECISAESISLRLPNYPVYLDALMGREFWTGVIPKIGKKFVQVVSIDGFPLEAEAAILNALTQIPITYRWSTRFIFLDSYTAISQLSKYQKKWKQKVRGFYDQLFNRESTNINKDALDMVQDVNDAIAETESGLVSQGYYTSVIILQDESRERLTQSALALEKAINNLGFQARLESLNTVEAYLGSLPGHGYENVRTPILSTYNLAHLMPMSSVWTGRLHSPNPMLPPNSPPVMHCLTSGNAPFRLNLHVRDLGHAVMFGPTRSGKSTHLSLLAMQWLRYRNAKVYCFDKGLSMYPTTAAVGGAHYVIGGEASRLAFAPLQFLDTEEDRAWAMDWLNKVLLLNGLTTSAHQRNEIACAIMNMHASGTKTLSEFSLLIQDEHIRETLKQYTVDGLMGHLIDAEEDHLNLSHFMTFEIEALMNLGNMYAIPILLYLFRRIYKRLDGSPTLLLLDEASFVLEHPVFRQEIKSWLLSMAKKNCAVLMSTQLVSHASESGIFDVIVQSTATKIFLPNPHARDTETAKIYQRMGLNDRQIDIIASATPKRDYYYFSEEGGRLYQLALGPFALAFAGCTDLDSIDAIRSLEQQHGKAWVSYWLRQKGLNPKKYGVREDEKIPA